MPEATIESRSLELENRRVVGDHGLREHRITEAYIDLHQHARRAEMRTKPDTHTVILGVLGDPSALDGGPQRELPLQLPAFGLGLLGRAEREQVDTGLLDRRGPAARLQALRGGHGERVEKREAGLGVRARRRGVLGVDLVPADWWDDLTDDDRRRLEEALARSEQEAQAGRVIPAGTVLRRLRSLA